MGLRSFLSIPLANYVVNAQKAWSLRPIETQKRVFDYLIKQAKNTAFGKEHRFSAITSYQDFKQAVPIRDYEGFRPYIERITLGEKDVLWKGRPLYFAKTSGTTSGIKYIPISKESIPYHIRAARNALLSYIYETGKSDFLDKKLIFLSGSPVLEKVGGIPTGRLSGIVNHHVPAYLRSNQMPSYQTNCIEDWEEKIEKIVQETLSQPMSLISGIPPWVQMYFDKIHQKTGKLIREVFPDFSVFVYGGVNFEPYKQRLFESIGGRVDSIETYPSSEGFIAFQDSQQEEGLLLLLNYGIYYEFIPMEEYFSENPRRLSLEEVEVGKNYALILNTNAGLWGYSIGDTVKFVSKNPYRLVVTGRVKHFISAFGEHVIAEEVEKAIKHALEIHQEASIIEFSVAPQVNPTDADLPYHEWLIAFENMPYDLKSFERTIDEKMQELNIYYKDLLKGKILRTLKITPLQKDAFQLYMKSLGKLGGQNKVPRLSNDRKLADVVLNWKLLR